MTNKIKWKTSTDRPLGVWILTIYAAIVAGIAPLALALFALLSGNAASIPGGGTIGLLGSIIISGSIIYYSIRTWQGKDNYRVRFLIFISLHYLIIAVNSYILIQGGELPADEVGRFWGRVGRGVLYPAFFIWYFSRPTVRSFFR